MNPTIRIQHATGAYTTFELDERTVAREFGPRKLVDLMALLYREQTFTNLTSLEMLPLTGGLVKEWQDERQIPWHEKIVQPTVEWRFQERFEDTTKANGPPIAVVHGNVNLGVFARVVGEFFGSQAVITGVHRS